MDEEKIEGYISKICLNGKIYRLQCEVVEVHPISCTKCGGPVELKFGYGKCNFCGTNYATNFKIEEIK